MIVKVYVEVMLMSCFVSDIFPLKVGTKWIYRIECRLFNKDVKLEVMDKKNNYYLLKFTLNNNIGASVILKCEVDLSVVGYSKKGWDSFGNMPEYEELSKTEILKSPVVTGTSWTNSFGTFNIVDSDCTFKLGNKELKNCIHMHLKDSSGSDNDIYIKEGTGMIFAAIYVDNIGTVNISIKKFN